MGFLAVYHRMYRGMLWRDPANWQVFTDFNWFDFLTCYGIIPISIAMFFIYKKKRKTKWVAYEDMDLSQPEDMAEARKHMSGME